MMSTEFMEMLKNFGVIKVPTEKRKSDILEAGASSWSQKIEEYKKIKPLDDNEVEAVQVKSPLWHKIEQKYLSTIEPWFEYDQDFEGYSEEQIRELQDFHERIQLKTFLSDAVADAMAFRKGGFLEIVFKEKGKVEDQVFQKKDGRRSIPSELKGTAFRLEYINPKTIFDIVLQTDREKEGYGQILYYQQKAGDDLKKIHIHPDRVIHINIMRKGSLLESLYRPIIALENIFHDAGIIIHRKGNPFLDVVLQTWDNELIKSAEEQLEHLQATNEFIHDIRSTINVLDIAGRALDPSKYAEIEWKGLAAGSGIPETLLFGAGQGTISTSDINMKDWFNTADGFRGFITKFIMYLDSLYWEMVHNEEKQFPIIWNDLYPPDKKRTSEVRKTNAEADEIYYRMGLPPELIDLNRQQNGLPDLFGKEYYSERPTEDFYEMRKQLMSKSEFSYNLTEYLDHYKNALLKEIRKSFES